MFDFSLGLASAGAGAVATAVAVPVIATALSFTAVGITGGSIAAWMMSTYGGNVAAGSLVAGLQSERLEQLVPLPLALAALLQDLQDV